MNLPRISSGHRHRGRHSGGPQAGTAAPRGDDRDRPQDGHAAAGRDAHRHPLFPADLSLARHGGRLCPRPVHRAGRLAAAELDTGTRARAADGRAG